MTEVPPPGEELPMDVTCVHCDASHTIESDANPDWLCPACDRYQDTTTCPTCHSVVRASLQGG